MADISEKEFKKQMKSFDPNISEEENKKLYDNHVKLQQDWQKYGDELLELVAQKENKVK